MASQALADKCYALAFSSGDQTAAYQAGVLKGLTEAYGAEQTSYTAISGVAGGAVNAAILASYPVGQEAAAVQRMQTFWENSTKQKLWMDWPAGVVQGMFAEGGIYNNQKLHDFLTQELVDIVPNQRYVDVLLTEVENAAEVDFSDAALSGGELVDVMFGNFAYPGLFAPENAMGADWFDGSLIWDVDLFSIVNQCMLTHAMEDIVVDVVLTEEKTLRAIDASDSVTYQVLLRAGRIIRYETQMDGLLRAEFAYPRIQFRNIIAPSAKLPETKLPLTYTQADVDAAITMGYQDALNSASNPTEAASTLKYFGMKRAHDKRIRGVSFEEFLDLDKVGHFAESPILQKKLEAMYRM